MRNANVETVIVRTTVNTKYLVSFSGLTKLGSMPEGGTIAGPSSSACICCDVAMLEAIELSLFKTIQRSKAS